MTYTPNGIGRVPMFAPPPQAPGFVGREKELDYLYHYTTPKRRSVIGITGAGGIGKTALVAQFLQMQSKRVEPFWFYPWNTKEPNEHLEQLLKGIEQSKSKRPAIVVIDGADSIHKGPELCINRILNYKRVSSVIITSRHDIPFPRIIKIHLDGLATEEAIKFLSFAALRPIPYGDIHALVDRAGGYPLALVMIAQLLKDNTVEQILYKLDGNLRDLDFNISANEEKVTTLVVPRIILANENLINRLKHRPEAIHQVSPRKFEELIADLLSDMGWEVELTPQSKDGGKDILAVLKTEVGNLLCLVEAKHYSPERPIQVGLVRQLFGTYVDYGANSAMLVTSSTFTRGAREFQSKHQYQISLKEYADIVTWIQKYKCK